MRASRKRKNREEDSRRKRFRGIVVCLLMGGFGVVMYLAGQARLFQSGEPVAAVPVEQETLVKKSAPSKPKRAFGALLNEEASRVKKPQFTFFKTLDDPGLNNYVNLEGRVVKKAFAVVAPGKPAVTRVSISSSSKAEKKKEKHTVRVKVPEKSQKKISTQKKSKKKVSESTKKKPELKTGKVGGELEKMSVAKKEGTQWVLDSLQALDTPREYFWVQAGSFKKFEQASEFEGKLKGKGYIAFIRSTEIPSKGVWYRVYLGRYDNRDQAEREAKRAGKLLRIKPVVKKAG